MRVVVLIDAVTSCPLSLFAPRIPLRRPIGMLRDLCTIIAYAMYTGSNPETIIQTFLVHGHPITRGFTKRARCFVCSLSLCILNDQSLVDVHLLFVESIQCGQCSNTCGCPFACVWFDATFWSLLCVFDHMMSA